MGGHELNSSSLFTFYISRHRQTKPASKVRREEFPSISCVMLSVSRVSILKEQQSIDARIKGPLSLAAEKSPKLNVPLHSSLLLLL